MVVHATELRLPHRRRSCDITAAALDPHSHSLALLLSDSSLLLYPSLSLSAPSLSPPPHPTPVPPTVSSFAFLRLQPTPAAPSRILLLAAGPLRSSTLLRAWILSDAGASFCRARLVCSRSLTAGESAGGVLIPLRHGFSVALAGGVNVCAVHAPAERRIWVMSARLGGEEGAVSLVKCASIECTAPIFSMRVCMRVLILGEQGGVRVFPLRPLVEGLPVSMKAGSSNQCVESNGGALKINASGAPICNGEARDFSKFDRVGNGSAKRKVVNLRQDSGTMESFYVDLNYQKGETLGCKTQALSTLKAISIQPLSLNKFFILDSVGDVHILCLHKSGSRIEVNGQVNRSSRYGEIKHLESSMRSRMLAAYADTSEKTQYVWISDGSYSIHVLAVTEPDQPFPCKGKSTSAEMMTTISVLHAIFSSEKIQDIIAYDAHSIIVLGQAGTIYACSCFGG